MHHHFQLHVVLRMRTWALDSANGMMKAAEGGDLVGETARIVIGFGQVVHHLCTFVTGTLFAHRSAYTLMTAFLSIADDTLTYCILWPTEMEDLMAMAAVLAFDPFESFKVPCLLVDGRMPYYIKLQILTVFPIVAALALSGMSFFLTMTKAHFHHTRRTRRKVTRKAADAAIAVTAEDYKKKMRGSARRALETCVSLFCMIMDFAYPVATRTILDIFQCRNLGENVEDREFFLEADYSLKCYDDLPAQILQSSGSE